MSSSKLHLKALSRAWLQVRGPDAERFLNGMWSCDFKLASKFAPSCGSGLLLNVKGKAVTEAVFLCRASNDFLLSIPASEVASTFEALDRYLVADEVEMKVLEGPDAPFDRVFAAISSPFARDLLETRVPPLVPQARDLVFRAAIEDWGLRIPRAILSPSHEELWLKPGFELPVANLPMSDVEWNQARLKAGVPEWGVDVSPEHLPLEFPLFHEISFNKGCYTGQEVIARATYRGHMPRGWVRVRARSPLEAGYVYSSKDPEKPVGKLSTVVGCEAMGLLRFSAIEDGASLYQTPDNPFESIERLLPEKPLE